MTEQQPTEIYELVDATDDEQYYTLGVFTTREGAFAAGTAGDSPPTMQEVEDCCILEIRKRPLDSLVPGPISPELTIEWSQTYNEDTDEDEWSYTF